MLHEKFIEISSVNNLSYQRPFINRFSISKDRKADVLVAQLVSQKLLLDFWKWCVLSFFSCFIHAHNGSAHCSRRPVIAHQSQFWHRREKCEGGWTVIISNYYLKSHNTCWNPTIIEIYWIASQCYPIESCALAIISSWKHRTKEWHLECMSEQWNHSIYHFGEAVVESLNFQSDYDF